MVVATVPTVYGIETNKSLHQAIWINNKLQQYLPFTVLKHVCKTRDIVLPHQLVATVPTVYGIETP